MKKLLAILLLTMTGCVTATVEDDIVVHKQIDVASEYTAQLQALKNQYGSYIPADAKFHVSLPGSTKFDVSKELRDLNDESYGVEYKLTNIVATIKCGSRDCYNGISSVKAAINGINIIDVDAQRATNGKLTARVTADVTELKKSLEAGESTLDVTIDADVSAEMQVTTKYDVDVAFHVQVNVDKSL